ncbi:docking protein 1-like [Lampris incognitus]|uniref:docking protein 1-like n=1 Tax=Lampris incognitus TaxID=2546036 RepID=UPI0024B56329|nr:docking protein 1-like [Lampris incognitus]
MRVWDGSGPQQFGYLGTGTSTVIHPKWKQVWLSLFPASRSGMGRLEIQVMGESKGGVRKHHAPQLDRKLKVVRLSDILSVFRLPPQAEACPKENMAAFCVETEERTCIFATVKDECADWVERICDVAFQRGSVYGLKSQLQMEENEIYALTDEVCEFSVVVQPTEAAVRCGLQGAYWLQVGRDGLVLREVNKKRASVWGWPYRLLRRYGKDELSLSIEAGRRCQSGPGTFTFETVQAGKIFSIIENAIKQERASVVTTGHHPAVTISNKTEDGERVVAGRTAHSPLPKLPDMNSMASILAKKKPADFSQSTDLNGQSECLYAEPADSTVLLLQGQSVYSQPADRISSDKSPAPISLLPLPEVPSHFTCPVIQAAARQSEPLYADPVDCVRSLPKPVHKVTTSLYVDPASVLPLKPPSSAISTLPPLHASATPASFDLLDPVYSEVFDKVTPTRNKQKLIQDQKTSGKCFANEEPIYAEPMRETTKEKSENATKPDPFAHLYAKVCKPTNSSLSSSTSTFSETDSFPSSSSSSSSDTPSLSPSTSSTITA